MTEQKTPFQEEIERGNQLFFRRRKLFEPLVLSEAWKELELIYRAQVDGQFAALLQAPDPDKDGMTSALRDQYHKGVVFGLKLMMTTPHATIAEAKDILDTMNRQQKDNGNASRRFDNTDDDGTELPDGARVTDLSGADQ